MTFFQNFSSFIRWFSSKTHKDLPNTEKPTKKISASYTVAILEYAGKIMNQTFHTYVGAYDRAMGSQEFISGIIRLIRSQHSTVLFTLRFFRTQFGKYGSRMLFESSDNQSLQILSSGGYETLFWVKRKNLSQGVPPATKRISQSLPYFMRQKSVPPGKALFTWTNGIGEEHQFDRFKSFIEEHRQMFCLVLFDIPVDPIFYKLHQRDSCNLVD